MTKRLGFEDSRTFRPISVTPDRRARADLVVRINIEDRLDLPPACAVHRANEDFDGSVARARLDP
jgi:hypothetical protein